MEYLKSGKGSDCLKYQLSRSQVYLKPTIEFMSCPYFNNCTISINVNGVAKTERKEINLYLFCSVSVIAFWN